MAQQQKKKTGSSAKSGGRSTTKRSAPAPKRRSYRGVAAVICLVLGIFSLLGYFNNDGVFIKFLRTLMSGLLGGGFYLLPPALMVCGVFLGIYRDKFAVSRAVCTGLIPVMTGAFCQLFSKAEYKVSGDMFSSLWTDGTQLHGGGAVGGTVTVLCEYLFSKTGTAILFVCLSALMIMTVCGLTIPEVVDMIRNRSRREDYEEDEAEEEPQPRRSKKQNTAASNADAETAPTTRRRRAIDIPIDEADTEEQKPKEKRPSFFNKKPNAPAPDSLYADKTKADSAESAPETTPEPVETKPAPAPEVKTEVKPEVATPVPEPVVERIHAPIPEPEVPQIKEPAPQKTPVPEPLEEVTAQIEESAKREIAEGTPPYEFPPITLLNLPQGGNVKDSQSELQATKERLEMTLRSFGINATISNIVNGPSITRYEMELEIGVKLNKLTNLSDDIALSLGVGGVRIAAIPNKISTVGIEVPNKNVSTVYFRELISSPEFKNAKSKLTFAIGKNISGDVMVGNIAKLPHLLVAGTTGSGKSVCLNSLILSLMYKASPEEVKFIMIDPKMVEFKIYNGIPHLLIPVVTEAKKAAGALQWAVTEMMKRYRLFSDTGARDLAGYNEIMKETDEKPLPQIVVIIDELADLMMIAAKEVEESICRVAQMGRAAGVHLVIATQSPRADVITGLMKANIPSRIAFKVASSLESRIILDAGGAADKLVGNGDMLFAPIGTSKPTRIQGAWVSDEEREQVVNYIKESSEASYDDAVLDQIERAAAEKETGKNSTATQEEKNKDYDDLLPQAADVIFDTKQASVSMLQRRLKLGYARAARLVDQLEEIGVVGPFEGSKPRQILITREQWQEMQYVNGTAPIEKVPTIPTDPQVTMTSADDLFESDESESEE
jgi:S-DNA-T family DNA segregation ATPase FtsK/SpoIIIE